MLKAGALTNPNITPETSPRGVKRSRSPDTYGDLPPGDGLGDDGKWKLGSHLAFSIPCYHCACSHVLLCVVPMLGNLLMMSHFR